MSKNNMKLFEAYLNFFKLLVTKIRTPYMVLNIYSMKCCIINIVSIFTYIYI